MYTLYMNESAYIRVQRWGYSFAISEASDRLENVSYFVDSTSNTTYSIEEEKYTRLWFI